MKTFIHKSTPRKWNIHYQRDSNLLINLFQHKKIEKITTFHISRKSFFFLTHKKCSYSLFYFLLHLFHTFNIKLYSTLFSLRNMYKIFKSTQLYKMQVKQVYSVRFINTELNKLLLPNNCNIAIKHVMLNLFYNSY